MGWSRWKHYIFCPLILHFFKVYGFQLCNWLIISPVLADYDLCVFLNPLISPVNRKWTSKVSLLRYWDQTLDLFYSLKNAPVDNPTGLHTNFSKVTKQLPCPLTSLMAAGQLPLCDLFISITDLACLSVLWDIPIPGYFPAWILWLCDSLLNGYAAASPSHGISVAFQIWWIIFIYWFSIQHEVQAIDTEYYCAFYNPPKLDKKHHVIAVSFIELKYFLRNSPFNKVDC